MSLYRAGLIYVGASDDESALDRWKAAAAKENMTPEEWQAKKDQREMVARRDKLLDARKKLEAERNAPKKKGGWGILIALGLVGFVYTAIPGKKGWQRALGSGR